jgi:hypothetical protein
MLELSNTKEYRVHILQQERIIKKKAMFPILPISNIMSFSQFLNPGIVYFHCYGAALSTGDFLKMD